MTTLQRAIAVLDPVNTRIAMMTDAEKAEFKLSEGFNDTNPSVIERAVKKLYCTDGSGTISNSRLDAAAEALQNIYDYPASAIPVVLRRLKQKDEDFQRALREWNKVWREIDAKNWYRALDHQSVPFKTNDKKNLSGRTLITAIEDLRNSRQQQRVAADTANAHFIPPERSQHQFELRMNDKKVLFDVIRLIFSYLGRVQSAYSLPERERVEGSIRIIVQLVLGITQSEMNEPLGLWQPEHADEDSDSEDTGQASEAGGSTGDDHSGPASTLGEVRRRGVKASAADLRRRLLASTVNGGLPEAPLEHGFHSGGPGPKSNSEISNSEEQTKTSILAGQKEPTSEPTWVQASSDPVASSSNGTGQASPSKEPSSQQKPDGSSATRRYNFFANDSFYCFFRVFHVSRLPYLPAHAAYVR